MKKSLIALSLALIAGGAFAHDEANNIGSCGLGSKLFAGQSGVFPQILAATTNGSFSNQAFGISSGTLGCTQNGMVSSNWKSAMFIEGNKLTLARDTAAGQGESLDALASVMGVKSEDKAALISTMKAQFATVFADEAVVANLKKVLASDARFAAYAATI
jgi:hypothetical protein